MNKRGNLPDCFSRKKGQVTLFIIIALLVVGASALFYFLSPELRTSTLDFDETSPQAFMQTCLEDDLRDIVETVSLQGGSVEPEYYFTYNNIPIKYLCYTNEDGEWCKNQQQQLEQHIESEIKDEIEDKDYVNNCFIALVESYQERGYNTQLDPGVTIVDLKPKRIIIEMNYILTVSEAETERFEDFNITLNNNLYELVSIANSIIEREITEEKADPRNYMDLHEHIEVERILHSDGTNIYTILDENTGDKFQLASRSHIVAPGH